MNRKCCIVALLCIWLTMMYTVEAEVVELETVGKTLDTATTIQVGQVYYAGEAADAYANFLEFETDEAGVYTIYLVNLRNSEVEYPVFVYNEYYELFDTYLPVDNVPGASGVLSLTLNGKSKYYIQIGKTRAKSHFIHTSEFTNYFRIAVCSPSTHAGLGVGVKEEASSCTTEGRVIGECGYCKRESVIEVTSALGHTPDDWQVIQAMTCTTDRITEQRCTVCGEVIDSITDPAPGHDPGAPVRTEPTCMSAGSVITICKTCGGIVQEESIPALPHTLGEPRLVRDATCTQDGLSQQICSVCNTAVQYVSSVSIGHTAGKWVDLVPASCTADGKRVQYCSVCNATLETQVSPATGHQMKDWQVTKEAGFFTEGRRERLCALCDASLESESIPVSGMPIVLIALCIVTVAGLLIVISNFRDSRLRVLLKAWFAKK